MKHIIFASLFLLLCNFVNGHNPVIDSLIKVSLSKVAHDTSKIKALNTLCWDYRRFSLDSSLLFGKKALALSEKKKLTSQAATAHTNLGVAYWFKGSMDSCKFHFFKAYNIRVEMKDSAQIGRAIMNIGNLYYANAMLDSALYYQLKSVEIKKKFSTPKDVAQSYNNIALIYAEKGDRATALEYNLKSLKIVDEIKDSASMSFSYNNIGNLYFEMGQFQKSLDYHLMSLKIKENSDDKLEIAFSYSNIANAYQEMKDYKKALESNEKALTLRLELKDTVTLAHSFNNMGLLYKDLGQYEKAIEYQKKALEIREKTKDEIGLTESYINLGSCYFFLEDYDKAISYYEKSLSISQKTDILQWQKESRKGMHETYYAKGNYKLAYDNFSMFFELHDSLYSEQQANLFADMESKYESDKKQKEIELLNKERALNTAEISKQEEISKRKTLQIYSIVFVMILVLFILLIIYKNSRKTKQANTVLNQKNAEISHQKTILEEAYKEISDSIKYAQRLQIAILPSFEEVNKHILDNFILFKPKNVVSGDFYWFEHLQGVSYIAAADCTGHGVPGAMVSVVCSNALNRSVKEFGFKEPSEILNKTRELVIETFAKNGEEVKDGMDISLCALSSSSKGVFESMKWVGANNPLWIVRETELLSIEEKETSYLLGNYSLIEHKPNKQPVGLYSGMKSFEQKEIKLYKGDSLYIFTDGFADQFGGPKGKKLMYKPFKKILLESANLSMEEQRKKIQDEFMAWKGNYEQVDDICVIGMRI